MELELIGTIEPLEDVQTGRKDWIDIIDKHPSLSPGQPRSGVNPFTKSPMTYRPALDYARIIVGSSIVGAIHWTEDGSRCLDVLGLPNMRDETLKVAKDVAARLGWHLQLP